jgi:hypothetical protein
MISVAPPGGNGIIKRIGRLGHADCANACGPKAAKAAPAEFRISRRLDLDASDSFCWMGVVIVQRYQGKSIPIKKALVVSSSRALPSNRDAV